MFKSRNNRGFTLAELAATLGVFALAATILTPAFSGVSAISNSNVTVSSNGGAADASPFAPPVDSILINVINDATGTVIPVTVNDPNATSATIPGLDPQASYTVEVAKKNQAGVSPAAVAKVGYIKVGEVVVDTTRVEKQPRDDQSKPIMVDNPADKKYVDGAALTWAQKWTGNYGTRQENFSKYVQYTTTLTYKTVNKSSGGDRIEPFSKQGARIAPFSKPGGRIAPFERTTYTPASSYTYSCTKSRTVSSRCGNTTYTYTGSCTGGGGTRYCTGGGGTKYCSGYSPGGCSGRGRNRSCWSGSSYSYACGSNPTYRYACGTSPTYTYSCQKTGSEPKYCSSNENYQSTCTGTTPASSSSTPVYNYAPDVAVYNYAADVPLYNYSPVNTWTEQVPDGTTTSSSTQEGSCSANGSSGYWTGVTYSCSDLSGPFVRTVTDYGNKIMTDDKSKPLTFEQKFDRFGKKHNGLYEQMMVDITIPGSRTDNVFGSRTTQKVVKANPGQLLLNVNSVQAVKGRWKSATVAAAGIGASQTVGSRVNFTTARLVVLNGTQYLVVDSRAVK